MTRALILFAVGCGAAWPKPVSVSAPNARTIHSVDVLPVDFTVWTEPGYDANPEQLRSTATMHLANTTIAALASRSLGVSALIDWHGDYAGGTALAPDVLAATIDSLAGYVATGARLPEPRLPATLGAATGADATLYIGGWAYVANHHDSVANKIAEDVTIGLVVAVAAVATAEVASRSPRAAELATDAALAIAPHHPDWAHADGAPRSGDSKLFLEMTLVDNRTGLARWHAHQVFPANATSRRELERAANALLASLP